MPGSQDPSFWQQVLDNRFVQALAFAFSVAIAFGLAIGKAVKRVVPQNRAEDDLKRRLETGAWQEVVRQLHDIRKEQAELGERIATIEGYLKSDKGA